MTGIPVRTSEGLWLAALTNKGLIIYPWGGSSGYILEGEFFYHDAQWINNAIRIGATNSRGAWVEVYQALTAPRTDLRSYRPTSGSSAGRADHARQSPAVARVLLRLSRSVERLGHQRRSARHRPASKQCAVAD